MLYVVMVLVYSCTSQCAVYFYATHKYNPCKLQCTSYYFYYKLWILVQFCLYNMPIDFNLHNYTICWFKWLLLRMIMVVVKTIWGYDMQHIIELCFDGILFHLMWTPPHRYVNIYELGFSYPQYTTEDKGQCSWTDWMQQNYIPYIKYNNHTAEEPCH